MKAYSTVRLLVKQQLFFMAFAFRDHSPEKPSTFIVDGFSLFVWVKLFAQTVSSYGPILSVGRLQIFDFLMGEGGKAVQGAGREAGQATGDSFPSPFANPPGLKKTL